MKRRRYILTALAPRLLFLLVPSLVPLALAQRTFTIRNNCDFTLWPAVTNYGTDKTQYTGLRGWEVVSGSETEIEIPSPWNGRIWARRECSFDGDGKGSCTTGNVEGGLEVDDQTIGEVNVGEFNLDAWGGNDFWDISCVPGWTVPMAIEAEPDECQSVICADDLNKSCPDDRMKQLDKDGKVIGCLSACMAKINSEDPSINCCSGKYNSKEACHFDEVDYYDVLKPFCQNAYWYPYDFQPNSPTVDWSCPTSKNANYRITFCPDGETTKNDDTIYEGGVTFAGEEGKETGAGGKGNSTKTDEGTSSAKATGGSASVGGSSRASATQTDLDDVATSEGGSESSAGPTSKATPSDTSSSSSSSSARSDDTLFSSSTSLFGYPQSTVLMGIGGIAAILVIMVGLFCCFRSRGEVRGGSQRELRSLRKRKDAEESEPDSSESSFESEEEIREVRRR